MKFFRTDSDALWIEWLGQWTELLQAGLPVLEALHLSANPSLCASARNKRIRQTLEKACESLQQGINLHDAFTMHHPALPSPLDTALRCAQTHGDLADQLTQHWKRWKTQQHTRQSFYKSLYYPLFVLSSAALCSLFIRLNLNNSETSPLIEASIQTPWLNELLTFGFITLTILCGLKWRKFAKKKKKPNSFSAWLPSPDLACARYFFLMACELESGFDLLHSLRQRPNPYSKRQLLSHQRWHHLNQMNARALRNIEQGVTLKEAFAYANAPDFLTRQLGVAQQTGNLPHAFALCANIFEAQAQTRIRQLQAILGPFTLMLAAITLIATWQTQIAPLYNQLLSAS